MKPVIAFNWKRGNTSGLACLTCVCTEAPFIHVGKSTIRRKRQQLAPPPSFPKIAPVPIRWPSPAMGRGTEQPKIRTKLLFNPGVPVVVPSRALAEETAIAADSHVSIPGDIQANVFCDASKSQGLGSGTCGGIAVTLKPWLPSQQSQGDSALIEAAWPVDLMLNETIGEALSTAQGLQTLIEELTWHSPSPWLIGQAIYARLFNDNKPFLEYLSGSGRIKIRLQGLLQPIIDLIADQIAWIQNHPNVRKVEIHWVPGHDHTVESHISADKRCCEAQDSGKSFCSRRPDNWQEEAPVVSLLKARLAQAILQATSTWPEVRAKLKPVRGYVEATAMAQPQGPLELLGWQRDGQLPLPLRRSGGLMALDSHDGSLGVTDGSIPPWRMGNALVIEENGVEDGAEEMATDDILGLLMSYLDSQI